MTTGSPSLRVAALAGATTAVTATYLAQHPPGGAPRWARQNFHAEQVDLLGGPAVTAGLVAAAVAARARGPLLALPTVAALGLYDDLAGSTHARGLRGHAQALARGQVTTGAIKLAGLVAAGVVAGSARGRSLRDVATRAALVSGTANLVNLLDLRPGRALKATLAAAVPLAAGRGRAATIAAGVAGAAVAALPADLGEKTMLGDCGANTIGAALGWAAAERLPPRRQLAVLAAVVAATVASEFVSFSALIDRTPALAAIDSWGRRP